MVQIVLGVVIVIIGYGIALFNVKSAINNFDNVDATFKRHFVAMGTILIGGGIFVIALINEILKHI